MNISIIAFLPIVAGIVGGLIGGRIYKKNKQRKKYKQDS